MSKIRSVSVRNFKSVKSITLTDCRRVNVLIGRPNVGKSNIIEALALFDIPYMVGLPTRSLRNLVRIENTADIFHNGDSSEGAEVRAGNEILTIARTPSNGLTAEISAGGHTAKYTFNQSLTLTAKREPEIYPNILTYFFRGPLPAEPGNTGFLLPPSGGNLMSVVAGLPELKSRLAELFHSYGLKMMFDTGSQQIKAMREEGLDMFLVPFGSLADSLQRLIFYKAAIESNRHKTICFEEPEAHTFPPYISNIAEEITEARENQYFITTHSPYVLNTLLERAGDELAVYVVDMKNNATTVKRLTDEQLQHAYDSGFDFFYNIEAFIAE